MVFDNNRKWTPMTVKWVFSQFDSIKNRHFKVKSEFSLLAFDSRDISLEKYLASITDLVGKCL